MLSETPVVADKLLKSKMIIRFNYRDPDLVILIDCSGDKIKIRLLPGEEPPPTPTPNTTHTIRSGDTAWGIAVEYGLSVVDLLAYNNMTSNSILSVGDTLLIVPPSPTPTATPQVTAAPPPKVTPIPTFTPLPEPTIPPTIAVSTELKPSPTSPPTTDGLDENNLPPLTATILVGLGLVGAGVIAIAFFRNSK